MELGLMVAPQQGASYEDQLRVAQLAERTGFDAFVRSDHLVAFGSTTGLPGPTDCWVTLGALARETSRILLGSMVSPATFRFPGPLAVSVAQADVMSEGRVIFGLGAGWHEGDHLAYGIPFPRPEERFDRLDEQLSIIRGLWSTALGERFEFHGTHYQVSDSPGLPKPAAQPHPPIVIGGDGPRRTPALAAAHADEFNYPSPIPGPAALAAAFERLDQACEARNRDPSTLRRSLTLTVVCGADGRDLKRRLHSPAGRFFDVSGTPDEVVDRLATYRELGVVRIYLRVNDLHDLEHIEVLGSSVVPGLRAATAGDS